VLAAVTAVIYLGVIATALPALARRLPKPPAAVSALRIRYSDGRGVLRRLLRATTARGFVIDELSAEPLNGLVGLGPDSQEGQGALNASPMVEVRLHVHGKYPVSELAAALSEVDGVASVLVGNDQAADD
jgi:putative Mg2+ transporter-C (MgtC) family protein